MHAKRALGDLTSASWKLTITMTLTFIGYIAGATAKTEAQQSLSRQSTAINFLDADLNQNGASEQVNEVQESMEERYREGRVYRDKMARFSITGDRIEITPSDGHPPLIVLENLALERIKLEVTRQGSSLVWNVVGELTEYEERNYILIRRATISSNFSDDN